MALSRQLIALLIFALVFCGFVSADPSSVGGGGLRIVEGLNSGSGAESK